jgi:L-amino acid N-acyltransferase YncA
MTCSRHLAVSNNDTVRTRVANAEDAAAIVEIYRPAITERVTSFEIEVPSAAEMAGRMTATLERYPWLVREDDSGIIGYAYATRHRDRAAYQWSVEVSAYVRDDQHRRGVGRVLYQQLFDLLAAQGFHVAYAGITLPNDASVAFHRAMGFVPVGTYRDIGYKFGKWHDVQWLVRRLLPVQDPLGDPVPFEEFRHTPQCEDLLSVDRSESQIVRPVV